MYPLLYGSYEEAARYLETYKAYENKPPDLLKERVDSDFSSRVRNNIMSECMYIASAYSSYKGVRVFDYCEKDQQD